MVTSSSLRWMSNALSTFNRGALEQGTEPPNSAVCPLLCVCVCVCTKDGLRTESAYEILGHMSRHFHFNFNDVCSLQMRLPENAASQMRQLNLYNVCVYSCMSESFKVCSLFLSLTRALSLSLYRRFNLWGHKHWRRWSKSQTDRGVSLCVSVWERKRERKNVSKTAYLGRVIANCVIFKWRGSGNSHFSARLLRVRTTTLKTVR